MMRHLVQDLRTGRAELVVAPSPACRPGTVVIATGRSLVSAGTERMIATFGRANMLEKARQHPDRVREVMDKVRRDGLAATVEAVKAKLDQPLPTGYSSAGRVIEVGAGVDAVRVGDRVVSNGPHAEIITVPKNLCARIPDSVSDDAAAFTVIGAIALQGIRLAEPTLGEAFVVTGLGLIGLMTVQLLRAHGCRVLGIDVDPTRLTLAEEFGAETFHLGAGADPVAAAMSFSRGRGVDGVILALTSQSSEPVSHAARMCRKRGRVVLVGVTGLELSRADFYEKEIRFQVSCSYGPGRYDPTYEEGGLDYPVGFVRWTEQRNFEAVLDMMAAGSLDVATLITHRFPFDRAPEAYDLLTSDEPSLGILLEFPEAGDSGPPSQTIRLREPVEPGTGEPDAVPVVSFIGAGNYATRILIPAFKAGDARLRSVATMGGASGAHAGRKHGFEEATTETERVFSDAETGVIVVATQHDSHASLSARALEAGKHVFVEKPLAISHDQLERVEAAYRARVIAGGAPVLMVGFNRRFADHVVRMKRLLQAVAEPKACVVTVNAGAVPQDHWTQDEERGGGRIVGEACHFVDLLRYLVGERIEDWTLTSLRRGGKPASDVASFTLRFSDGSHGTVHYLSNGHKGFPKERLEVFAGGRILQLENFRRLRAYGWNGAGQRSLKQDKGQFACVAAFLEAVRSGSAAPIPFDEILEVSRVSIALAEETRGR